MRALAHEFDCSGTSSGQAFSRALAFLAAAEGAASSTRLIGTSGALSQPGARSDAGAESARAAAEFSALSEFLRSVVAAEKLSCPEIAATNERNSKRNERLNLSCLERGEFAAPFSTLSSAAGAHVSSLASLSQPSMPMSLSQRSLSIDEDHSTSTSPTQSSGDGLGTGATAFPGPRPLLPPPCTPLRQVSLAAAAAFRGDSPTPDRARRKLRAVRFAGFDFSAVNAAPSELAPSAIPAPFGLLRSPRSIRGGHSAADAAQVSQAAGVLPQRDMTEPGCVVFALAAACSAAGRLRDALLAFPPSPPTNGGGGSNSNSSSSSSSSSGSSRSSVAGQSFSTSPSYSEFSSVSPSETHFGAAAEVREGALMALDLSVEQRALAPEVMGDSETNSPIIFPPPLGARCVTIPLLQVLCAIDACASAAVWERAMSDAIPVSVFAQAQASVQVSPLRSNACAWGEMRGAARFYTSELALLRAPSSLPLPLHIALSNAVSSAARYHLRRALNPHVYDDDSEPGGILATGARPADPTATPPPPSKYQHVDGPMPGHHHHHSHRMSPALAAPVSQPTAQQCGGLGRGGGGIRGGYLSMVAGSGNLRYNSDDLAAILHEALRTLHNYRARVVRIISPHRLASEGGGGAESAPAIASDAAASSGRPLSLLQIVDACPLSDLGYVAQFADAHTFVRSLFGHEEALAALASDGDCWKRLRTLARIADEYGCDSERHLLPLAAISNSALAQLLDEGATVDRLVLYANTTLDRHSRALEAVRPRTKRGSSGGVAAMAAAAALASSSSSSSAVVATSSSTHAGGHAAIDDGSDAGRNGLASRNSHDRPRKKRHAHSRLASPAPADRQRFLELVAGHDVLDDDEAGAHYPEPVPPRRLDMLMLETHGDGSALSACALDEHEHAAAALDPLNLSGSGSGGSAHDADALPHASAGAAAGTAHMGASRLAACGGDASIARAHDLLEHEDIIDKRLRFAYPRLRFVRCSLDAREVYDTDSGAPAAPCSSAPLHLPPPIILSFSAAPPKAAETARAVHAPAALSAPPVAHPARAAGAGRSSAPAALSLDDLLFDVMRKPGPSSAAEHHFGSGASAVDDLQASAASLPFSLSLGALPALPLFRASTGAGPGPSGAKFAVASSTCAECRSSLAQPPPLAQSQTWEGAASPGTKRREARTRAAGASADGSGVVEVVRCTKCDAGFHTGCTGVGSGARFTCNSCQWRG
jgi:hypothetical protein